jgi:hypothetical protein
MGTIEDQALQIGGMNLKELALLEAIAAEHKHLLFNPLFIPMELMDAPPKYPTAAHFFALYGPPDDKRPEIKMADTRVTVREILDPPPLAAPTPDDHYTCHIEGGFHFNRVRRTRFDK